MVMQELRQPRGVSFPPKPDFVTEDVFGETDLDLIETRQANALFELNEHKNAFKYPGLLDILVHVYGNPQGDAVERVKHNFRKTRMKIHKILTRKNLRLSPNALDFVDWVTDQDLYRYLSKADLALVLNRDITVPQLWEKARILKQRQEESERGLQQVQKFQAKVVEIKGDDVPAPVSLLPEKPKATQSFPVKRDMYKPDIVPPKTDLKLEQYEIWKLALGVINLEGAMEFSRKEIGRVFDIYHSTLPTLTGTGSNYKNLEGILGAMALAEVNVSIPQDEDDVSFLLSLVRGKVLPKLRALPPEERVERVVSTLVGLKTQWLPKKEKVEQKIEKRADSKEEFLRRQEELRNQLRMLELER